MDLDGLGPVAIRTLGPYLLGRTAWRQVPKKDYYSWEEFKEAVDRKIGLTRAAMKMAFRSLTKDKGETDEAFIVRAEEERKR